MARLTLQSPGQTMGLPRLTLADRRAVPAGAFAVGTVNRAGPSRFAATVAIVWPRTNASAPPGASPTKFASLRLPSGYRLVGSPQVVRNALYTNRLPSFGLLTGGVGSVLAGSPPLLTLDRIARDAQLLALDRSVPLADMGLLGLEFVAVQFSKIGSTALQATIGTTGLSQVSAIELRFPPGVAAPAGHGGGGTGTLRWAIRCSSWRRGPLPGGHRVRLHDSAEPPAEARGRRHCPRQHALLREQPAVRRALLRRLSAVRRRRSFGDGS